MTEEVPHEDIPAAIRSQQVARLAAMAEVVILVGCGVVHLMTCCSGGV